jgi:hypothetical protein
MNEKDLVVESPDKSVLYSPEDTPMNEKDLVVESPDNSVLYSPEDLVNKKQPKVSDKSTLYSPEDKF